MVKEIEYLGKALEKPEKPFIALLGGVKVSGKIDVINNLFEKVDKFLIGGAMAFTFIKAQGGKIGDSFLEQDRIDMAGELIAKAKELGTQIVLPSDAVCAKEIEDDVETEIHPANKIPNGLKGLDIGPETAAGYVQELMNAKTVVWNGPMGVFEVEKLAEGTMKVAKALAEATSKGTTTIVGGGDSAAAAIKSGLKDKFSHVSTGGGASLEFLEGKELPGVAALTDK
jgi:phosphoglycerate kinase